MKPARNLPGSWFSTLPRERRMALLSVGVLLLLLGALVLYQRLWTSDPGQPLTPVEPPRSVGGLNRPMAPVVPDPAGSPGVAPAAQEGQTVQPPATAGPEVAAPPAPMPTRLDRPLAGQPRLIKSFGSLDEAYGDSRLFPSVVFAAHAGDSVLAAAAGRVAAVEQDPADGLTLLIEHAGGMQTRYAGLVKALVAPGAHVQGGSIIGEVGDRLVARPELGAHLAFGVLIDAVPVDPLRFLPR